MTIELKDISHRFGTSWVLKNNTVTIPEGQVVALLGPNGSGKSTLLRILATLLPPTRGDGLIFGYSLRNNKNEIRRRLHWLGHDFQLYQTLSARENLEFFYKLQGEKPNPEKIQETLREVSLFAHQNRTVSQFSAGMRKRLSLARLLLKETPLVLLDEPHTNLDQDGRLLMNRCIANWKKKGTTLILASHEEATILPLCDTVMTLKEGHLHL